MRLPLWHQGTPSNPFEGEAFRVFYAFLDEAAEAYDAKWTSASWKPGHGYFLVFLSGGERVPVKPTHCIGWSRIADGKAGHAA